MSENAARPPDPIHAARTRFFAAGLARRLMATPPDASKHSRAMRLYAARTRTASFARQLAEVQTYHAGMLTTVRDDRIWDAWFGPMWEAFRQVRDAFEDGEPLDRFLFPS